MKKHTRKIIAWAVIGLLANLFMFGLSCIARSWSPFAAALFFDALALLAVPVMVLLRWAHIWDGE